MFNRRKLASLVQGSAKGLFALTASVLFLAASQVSAEDGSKILLKVERLDGTVVEFSREDLEALEQVEFVTSSPWTEGEKTFSGPPLTTVLNEAGIDHKSVTMVAQNLYTVDIAEDEDFVRAEYPIVATRIDGETYSLREKGPLWIMYPLDSNEFEVSQKLFTHSIWQLIEIHERESE